MEEKITLISLENLGAFKTQLVSYVDTADAKALKTVAIEDNVLKFYTVSEPVGDTAPVYEIELPETDLTAINSAISTLNTNVGTNTAAIAAINNEETGILAQAKEYADGKDEAIEAAQKAADDAQADVDDLAELVGAIPEGYTATTIAGYAKELADAVAANGYDDTEVRGLIEDNADAISAMEEAKADKATTLAGYGITDAYTKEEVDEIEEGAKVTVSTATTTDGYLKSYTIKQGDTAIGVIDIPKDLVVTGGEIVTDPDEQPAGTYIKLTIANQTDPIYINVKDLVDAYTAQASATQIQLAISETNEISATIVAGSVGTTELANAGVTAAKLAEDAKALFDATGAAATALTDAKAYVDGKVGAGYTVATSDQIAALFE